jgi:hypothetical protein
MNARGARFGTLQINKEVRWWLFGYWKKAKLMASVRINF